MDNQTNDIVSIHINGCTVTVPAEKERLYREFLADKWINGCHVYVKDGDVKIDIQKGDDGVDLDTMEKVLIEQNHKLYALAGKL